MTLIKWDPFREIVALQNSVNRLFDENLRALWQSERKEQAGFFPVDIKETPEDIVIKAELPGMAREDIKVTFNDGLITIKGERRQESREENGNFLRVERRYGTFSRTFSVDVPVKAAEIKASYKDGVLEVILPRENESKAQEVQIQVE
ncbi:MAG: Hsp20/alpha crystallin family protein [Desulfurispora sp.]|uniref:Hsp20/alpha crystallin family protein n=1 Tax=Desulfurispora sp. TaxID=3014275 RepID=UPI00404AAE62